MAKYAPDTVEFPVVEVGGVPYINVSQYYETHRRGKNYVARITGAGGQYKWKREFLKFKTLDGERFVPLAEVMEDPVEFAFIYYTGSGHPQPNLKGFYRFKEVKESEDGKVAVFERMTEKQLTDYFAEKQKQNKHVHTVWVAYGYGLYSKESAVEILMEFMAEVKARKMEKEFVEAVMDGRVHYDTHNIQVKENTPVVDVFLEILKKHGICPAIV